jgi:transposase
VFWVVDNGSSHNGARSIALLRVVELGIDARKPLTDKQIALIAGWREREENIALRTGRREAVRLGKQIISLQKELEANRSEMEKLVPSIHPPFWNFKA